MIEQFFPNQYRSGNINISDRNQPRDGRSSELVVPIAVDKTISCHDQISQGSFARIVNIQV